MGLNGTSLGRMLLPALVGLAAFSCGGDPQPAAAVGVPSDWPMYGHDPQRTSFNPVENGISSKNVNQLAQAWQVDVGTSGVPTSGTPSVAAGRVYVGSSVTSGDNFFAFDATTGARLWTADLHYQSDPTCPPDETVGLASTSAISGSVLVVGGGDGAYYGLDAETGGLRWRHALDAGPSGFAWASPLVAGGRAYVGVSSRCDNPPVRGEIRSLDLASGSPLANQYFIPEGQGGAGIWNSPALSDDGATLVVATGEDNGNHGPYEQAIVTLDAVTLAILDANKQGTSGGDLDFASTPVVFHDALGRSMVGASHKDGLFRAYALGGLSSGPVWQRNLGAIVGLAPGYDPTSGPGGLLVIGGTGGGEYDGSNGLLHGVDPGTGEDRWPPLRIGDAAGNVALANHLIFVNQGPDGLHIYDTGTGQEWRELHPPQAGATLSGVAVAGGTIYWLSGSFLNAWRIPPGR